MKLNNETTEIDFAYGDDMSTLWLNLICDSHKATISQSAKCMGVISSLSAVINAFSSYIASPCPRDKVLLVSSLEPARESLDTINYIIGDTTGGDRSKSFERTHKATKYNLELIHLLDDIVKRTFIAEYGLGKRPSVRKSHPTKILNVPKEFLFEATKHMVPCPTSMLNSSSHTGVVSAITRAIYIRVADTLWNYLHLDAIKYYKLAVETTVPEVKDPYWNDVVRSIEQFTENNTMYSISRGRAKNRMHVEERVDPSSNILSGTPSNATMVSMNVSVYCSAMINYIMASPDYKENGDDDKNEDR